MKKKAWWQIVLFMCFYPVFLVGQEFGPHEGRYYLVYEELNNLQWLLKQDDLSNILDTNQFSEELAFIKQFIDLHIRNKDRNKVPAFLCIDRERKLAFYKSYLGRTIIDHSTDDVDYSKCYALIRDIRKPGKIKALGESLISKGKIEDVVHYVHLVQQDSSTLYSDGDKARLLTSFNRRFDDSQKAFLALVDAGVKEELSALRKEFTTVRSGVIASTDPEKRTLQLMGYDGIKMEVQLSEGKQYVTHQGEPIDIDTFLKTGNKVDIRMMVHQPDKKGGIPTAVKMDLRYSIQAAFE